MSESIGLKCMVCDCNNLSALDDDELFCCLQCGICWEMDILTKLNKDSNDKDARIKELGQERAYLADMCKDYYTEVVEKNERIEELEDEIEEIKEKNRE